MTKAQQTFSEMLKVFLSDSDSVSVSDLVTQYFTENQSADKVITADQLTSLISSVTEHDYSAKTVRADLRKIAARDQSQFRNASWRIDETLAVDRVKRFARIA